MTINTYNTLLATAAFFGGCTVVLLVQQLLRPLRWSRLRRRMDALIKVRLTQQLQRHEAQCPMVQVFTHSDNVHIGPEGTHATPASKRQNHHRMILAFMMTHYPRFIKELEEHTHTRLSSIEQQICFLVKLGIRNKQIAESLSVSPNSVIKTKQRLRLKLTGAPEGEELTPWIQRLGEPLDKMPPGYMVFDGEQTAEDEDNSFKK